VGPGIDVDAALGLVTGDSPIPIPDYADGWVHDPEQAVTRSGGSWSEVQPMLRSLSFRTAGSLTSGERAAIELIHSGTPWPRVEGESREVARRLYARLARSGRGEAIFVSGRAALRHLGYEERWLEAVPTWTAERFVGIGNPWRWVGTGIRSVLDLGCGAGADCHVARHLHPEATIVGLDASAALAGGAWRNRRPGLAFVVGGAERSPLPNRAFDLVVANGLPPMMGGETMEPALAEIARLLHGGGELRFTCLVVGPDEPIEQMTDADLFNSLRTGKPVLAAIRWFTKTAGLTVTTVEENPSPFVDWFRPAGVRSMTVRALKEGL
jgi:SAM-dependent methyltransferase